MTLEEMKKVYELSSARTRRKIEERKKKQERVQIITMIILFSLTTIYWK